MIKYLKISNIALVASAEIELDPGFTVLTGETGAGKSILIDALGLLLGERAGGDLVRTGEERASVEGLVESKAARALLEERALPTEGDEVVLRRELSAGGKGRAQVNGALVPASTLRDLAPCIAALHGQHEPQGLLNPETHLTILDEQAGLALAEGLAETYRAFRAVDDEIERLLRDRREIERRRETLTFQVEEIEKARLEPGEEEALRREKAVQANADRLEAASREAYSLLYEDEQAVLTRLSQALKKLQELAAMDPAFDPYLSGWDGIRAPLEDLSFFLRDYHEDLQVTPGRLDEIESRLALIERFKKKYGASVGEVLVFAQTCRTDLERLESPEARREALAERRSALSRMYLGQAIERSKRRRAGALELEKRIQLELAELAMEKSRFKVKFDPENLPSDGVEPSLWTERGFDRVEFLLSPNPGEDLRPLARIASGGELSRIMLALESGARHASSGLTLVFDEVDAGIGGRVAEIVGRRLHAIARRHQVLCVTHLPQIASLADHHYVVRKRVAKGRTSTEVLRLGAAERIEEIARMLGGETVTDTARDHAREMVNQKIRA
jgi:DNA repair protein RecN (Recombination protein N)